MVGEPPTEDASAVPTPSAMIARPIIGSRSVRVISATALTWPVFSAISAITAGSTSRIADPWNDGAWKSGSPIQAAAFTPSNETRGCVSTFPAPGLNAVMSPATLSSTQLST